MVRPGFTAQRHGGNKAAGVRFNVGLATMVPGGNGSGAELGMRHSF